MNQSLLLLLLLFTSLYFLPGSSCETYQGTICKDIAIHYPQPFQISTVIDQNVIEVVLEEFGFGNNSVYGPILLPKCYYAAKKFLCGAFFSPCDTNGGIIYFKFL